MKGLQLLHEEEQLNAAEMMSVTANANPCEFNDHMDEDKGIWPLDMDRDHQEDLLNNDSIFSDDFPALLDIPCMSSSSSSSSPSIPAPVKPITCSSSSSSSASNSNAVSWAVLKSDAEDQNPQPLFVDQNSNEVVDCMDVMESFGCMDLLEEEPNDFFDPSSQNPVPIEQHLADPDPKEQGVVVGSGSEDLAHVFLEWLKNNKESISAEDLRSVKIKKSTIECAAKRLGGGKEAMKLLLKLILEWVQTNHLQKRRCHQPPSSSSSTSSIPPPPPPPPPQWNPSQQQPSNYMMTDPGLVGYGYAGTGDPFLTPPVLDSAHSWTPSQFNYNSFGIGGDSSLTSPDFSGYPYQYLPEQGGERLVRLGSSATKEARKKRMARQRRFLSHHKIN